MISAIKIPSKEQLKSLVSEALNGVDSDTFISNHLKGVAEVLRKNPKYYRGYGPYWWAVKDLLKDHNWLVGEEDDPEVKAHFSYDDPVFLLCAAWAYQNHQQELGSMNSNTHPFEVDDEPIDYLLEDAELESLKPAH